MKIIKSDTGFQVYQKIFTDLESKRATVVVWQILPETGKREIAESTINSFHYESGQLNLQLAEKPTVRNSLPLYCYAEDGQLIFKTDISEVEEFLIKVGLPNEIKLLEEQEISVLRNQIGMNLSTVWKTKRLANDRDDLGSDHIRVKSMAERSSRDQTFLNNEFELMSLDEEDKVFADKRESPRARPKIDKWVKVVKVGSCEFKLCRLFDLSRGGMGFITFNEAEFPKGIDIHVLGFDEFDLDDPLIGTVMSLRPVDEAKIEFKVGIKFREGQN